MLFIDTLNSLLELNKISRNKLCADLGIGKSSVADWEKRGNIPDGEVLVRIATYFGVTVDRLLGIETPATPEGKQPELTETQLLANQVMEKVKAMEYDDLKALEALIDRLAQK